MVQKAFQDGRIGISILKMGGKYLRRQIRPMLPGEAALALFTDFLDATPDPRKFLRGSLAPPI